MTCATADVIAGGEKVRRIPIRDSRSKEPVKPRILDYVRTDDGTEMIETKDKNTKKTILLDDFLGQIEKARK